MSSAFRRDLELAPGAGFRLRRRLAARVFSTLLALAAIGWGAFDLWAGFRIVGAATIALAAAFVVQLVQAELDSWRFDGVQAVHRGLRGLRFEETRFEVRQIRGVQVRFVKGRARAWIELNDGGQVPLVEGDEPSVRRIADRLSASLQLASAIAAPRALH